MLWMEEGHVLAAIWARVGHAADGAAGGDGRRQNFQMHHCAEHCERGAVD